MANELVPERCQTELTKAARQRFDQIIYQSNELATLVRKRHSAAAKKIIYYLTSKIEWGEETIPMMIFDLRELCVVCGWDPDCRQNRSNLRTLLLSMTEISKSNFVMRGRTGWELPLPWLEYALVKRGSDLVAVRLNPKLAPFFLSLTSDYTKYDMAIAQELKGKYSLYLYELGKIFQFRGGGLVDVEEFQQAYALSQASYSKFSNLYSRVLCPAIEEVNAVTDIEIKITPIASNGGRKIDLIEFEVQSKLTENEIDIKVEKWMDTIQKYQLPDDVVETERRAVIDLINGVDPKQQLAGIDDAVAYWTRGVDAE